MVKQIYHNGHQVHKGFIISFVYLVYFVVGGFHYSRQAWCTKRLMV